MGWMPQPSVVAARSTSSSQYNKRSNLQSSFNEDVSKSSSLFDDCLIKEEYHRRGTI